jgi:hypothetical protein
MAIATPRTKKCREPFKNLFATFSRGLSANLRNSITRTGNASQ